MKARHPCIAVACVLLLGSILSVVAQGCGDVISLSCPRRDGSGIYDAWCLECAVDLSIKGCNVCDIDPQLGPSFACDRDAGAGDADATDSAVTDGGTSSCAGECLPAPPFGWEGPGLFWVGPGGSAPACPSGAPTAAYLGHADFVAPPSSCTPCTCSPLSGACAPPVHVEGSNGACPGGPVTVSFDASAGWDGTCAVLGKEAIPGGLVLVSITAGPLVLTETGCDPSAATLVPAEPPSFGADVLGCRGEYPAGGCNDLAKVCGPSAGDAPGFRTCIFQTGDDDCPPSYPEKQLAYAGFDDQRACSPCVCGPSDSSCKATLLVFEDEACATKPAVVKLDLTAAGPSCRDLPGAELGSKRLDALAYQPGACAPGGGEPVGGVDPVGASTFCCLASVG